jgi:hypothetical protein
MEVLMEMVGICLTIKESDIILLIDELLRANNTASAESSTDDSLP